MLTLVCGLFFWYVIGYAIFLHVCALIADEILLQDLLVGIIAAILGPGCIGFYLLAAMLRMENKGTRKFRKPVWTRGKKC